jgi:hypothetical protein
MEVLPSRHLHLTPKSNISRKWFLGHLAGLCSALSRLLHTFQRSSASASCSVIQRSFLQELCDVVQYLIRYIGYIGRSLVVIKYD